MNFNDPRIKKVTIERQAIIPIEQDSFSDRLEFFPQVIVRVDRWLAHGGPGAALNWVVVSALQLAAVAILFGVLSWYLIS